MSNQSGGSNTTPYYADVGSLQSTTSREQPPPLPSARPTYCVLEAGRVHRDTERDQSEPKHKSCSIKRACQCAVWTAIFLGISIGVALFTFNHTNANNLEKKIIERGNMFTSINVENVFFFTMHSITTYVIKCLLRSNLLYIYFILLGTILIDCQF